MTFFSSLGARRLALLAVVFVIGVACAKVDRNYDDSSAGADNGGSDPAAGTGGKAGSGAAGKGGTPGGDSAGESGEGGSMAEVGDAGSAGESAAGAGGAPSASLTVTLAGMGTGKVTSDLPGINCGTSCNAEFEPDTQVVLTATADASSTFTGWSGGGCAGTGPCTTTVTAATAVTATFALATQKLTVLKAGTGLGTVSSAPMGINCGTQCSQVVNYGTMVTLTAAVTGTGSVFSGWSGGGCVGTGTCVVTVTAATQVTATFTCSPGTLTVNYSGAITNFVVPSCVTSLTIDGYGAQGGNSGAYLGGYGARMKGTFAVTGGSSLKVLVGGRGIDAFDDGQQAGGSGGGGTFVTTLANAPLIVAGGGGGAIDYPVVAGFSTAGLGGTTGTAGLAGSGGAALGGTSGNGGTTSAWDGWHGGTGGGGLTGNGVGVSMGSATSYGTPYGPGFSFVNGGAGGVPGSCAGLTTSCIAGRVGGFGGGGAAGFTGGGGGGYSGGGAGEFDNVVGATGAGGGGGSFNNGTAQTNTAATRPGNGVVIFTY